MNVCTLLLFCPFFSSHSPLSWNTKIKDSMDCAERRVLSEWFTHSHTYTHWVSEWLTHSRRKDTLVRVMAHTFPTSSTSSLNIYLSHTSLSLSLPLWRMTQIHQTVVWSHIKNMKYRCRKIINCHTWSALREREREISKMKSWNVRLAETTALFALSLLMCPRYFWLRIPVYLWTGDVWR